MIDRFRREYNSHTFIEKVFFWFIILFTLGIITITLYLADLRSQIAILSSISILAISWLIIINWYERKVRTIKLEFEMRYRVDIDLRPPVLFKGPEFFKFDYAQAYPIDVQKKISEEFKLRLINIGLITISVLIVASISAIFFGAELTRIINF